ncbi:hypothetical protein CEQ48_05445 [Vibrio tarriae]|uniref:Uncharacterized protein n=1 Tax=Vibrio tarriae TaxID=2014742 RepID=A0AAU8WDK5_9VIBR|nr:hypothetical protein CEQ48_00005 [Vibrio tarriae]ASK54217.1 hypothetical protein CEQ48_05445 [Vibrio tarriae]
MLPVFKSRLDFLCYTLACREKMSSQAERTPSTSHHADTARQFPSPYFWTISRLCARPSRYCVTTMTTKRRNDDDEN